jgi:hypothetical protein
MNWENGVQTLMQYFLQTRVDLVSTIVIALLVVNLLITFGLLISNARLKRKLRKWQSIHTTADLERVYDETLVEVASIAEQVKEFSDRVREVEAKMNQKISTARILRYNAFPDVGSDLSFSIALLDDEQNGVVLSSIYGRQESRIYAKPIVHGLSKYPLTEEEEYVLNEASGMSTQKVKN